MPSLNGILDGNEAGPSTSRRRTKRTTSKAFLESDRGAKRRAVISDDEPEAELSSEEEKSTEVIN
jgi:hypothetical protein